MSFATTPLVLYRDSNNRRTLRLYGEGLDDPTVLPDGAVVRFKLADNWADDPPRFEIDTVSPSDNDSVIEIVSNGVAETSPATLSMLVTMEDLEEIPAGKYSGLFGWTDPEDSDRWKVIALGEVQVVETLGGETGTT